MARPTATRVAGFRGWLKLGYAVQRGERSIKVWAPCPPSRKQLERWQQDGGDADQRPRTYFRLVPVFAHYLVFGRVGGESLLRRDTLSR